VEALGGKDSTSLLEGFVLSVVSGGGANLLGSRGDDEGRPEFKTDSENRSP